MKKPNQIRNIAIIAHIDHGKTTMIDSILKEGKVFRENEAIPDRVMDSNTLEKERGITIFAKHATLYYDDYKINLIDTPGHADFSHEVERVLGMVQSVLLLVDAAEGPKPQTRFVLSKALKMGLRPIVVVNKIDRTGADPEEAVNKTFDLFVELGATDEQLDFPYIYASGLGGFAIKDLGDPQVNMAPLFEMIFAEVPPPPADTEGPFLMQVASISYNDFVGRKGTGRIIRGQINKNDPICQIDNSAHPSHFKVTSLESHQGLKEVEVESAFAGDIVTISGIPEVMIGDTLCDPNKIEELDPIEMGESTLSIDIYVNNSPFVGQDGKNITINKIRERIQRETKSNPTLKVEEITGKEDGLRLFGRGSLHLSVLFETMRREGFEFSISKPHVVIREIDGVKCEPYEVAHIEVPQEFSGSIIEELSSRKGEMRSLETSEQGITTLIFFLPTRALLSFRSDFLTMTRGEGILTSHFDSFAPMKGQVAQRKNGALVNNMSGKATSYAIFSLLDRGTFFVDPTEPAYEGMIVGEHSRNNDLVVNVTKGKQLTNVRASGTDESTATPPPLRLDLERAMEWIEEDELVEVTPKNIRVRKKLLSEVDRKRHQRKG